MTITSTYPASKFIRNGMEKIKTCRTGEAMYPGHVMNVQDMTEYDGNDTDLGVFLNDQFWNTNIGSQCSSGDKGYYIPLHDCAGVEVRMTEANSGSISAGAYVRVTKGGKIVTWTWANNSEYTDSMRDVIGRAAETIAQGSTGWVKLGRL